MAWRVFEKLKEKFTGKPAETPAATQAPPKPGKPEQPELSEGTGLKELEKKGLLGQFYRHWKNPAFLRQVQAIAGRMKADGIDLKDQKAVQVWVQAHQKEIESGAPSAAAAKPQTYVKTGPEPGRNDPCPCGSGRKHKKCCGTSK